MVVVEVFVGNRMVFEGDKEEAHNQGNYSVGVDVLP